MCQWLWTTCMKENYCTTNLPPTLIVPYLTCEITLLYWNIERKEDWLFTSVIMGQHDIILYTEKSH